MNLIIESKVDITDFCEWLVVEHITPYIATHINQKKAQRFDDIINKYIVTLPKRMLFTDDIILASAYNLTVSKEDDNHIIRIDSNAFIPNTIGGNDDYAFPKAMQLQWQPKVQAKVLLSEFADLKPNFEELLRILRLRNTRLQEETMH